MVTEHSPVPKQPPPLQPVKVEPGSGAASKVTKAPLGKGTEQVAPQSIPAGKLVTVPVPAPAVMTVSWNGPENVAVTDWAAIMVTTHCPVPEQAPLQPAKVEPVAASALRVTTVFAVKNVKHAAPQLIPEGELDTAPVPDPDL